MSADVVCMSLANVPPGEQRSRFLAVGLADNTVRIISLDPSVWAWHSDYQWDPFLFRIGGVAQKLLLLVYLLACDWAHDSLYPNKMSCTLVLGMSLPSLMFVPIEVCFGPSNIWPFSLLLIDSKDYFHALRGQTCKFWHLCSLLKASIHYLLHYRNSFASHLHSMWSQSVYSHARTHMHMPFQAKNEDVMLLLVS